MSPIRPEFVLHLSTPLLFAVALAFLTRWLNNRKAHGQTLLLVIVGVAGTVACAFVIGDITAETLVIIAAYFAVTGLPMAAEYILRVTDEQKRDREQALKELEDAKLPADRQD